MGKRVTTDQLRFVSFEPSDGHFIGLLCMDALLTTTDDLEPLLAQAAILYQQYVGGMRSMVGEIQSLRRAHKLTPARNIWRVGNAIFELTDALARKRLQVDGLYDHLVRDVGVKRKWLEKAVIFRRYLSSEELIPGQLNWGRCEKGTRRVAEALRDGLTVDTVASSAIRGRGDNA